MMRYVLHPRYVTSKNDGQEHFIGGPSLARLYGVDIRECVFGDVPEYREQDGDVHLHPDYRGNYTLPSNDQAQGPGGSSPGPAGALGSASLRRTE